MDDLERKLKAYYEHNYDYVPGEDFAKRLMALESRPMNAPKRRRRYILPVAAAIAAAVALGSAWAWLHAAKPDRSTDPDDGQPAQIALEAAPSRPAPIEEQSQEQQEAHPAGKPVIPAMSEPEVKDRSVPQFTAPNAAAPVNTPDPVPADDPSPADPVEPNPPEQAEDPPVIPPEENPPAMIPPEDDPPAVKPPEDDPPAVTPPEDDPPVITPPEEKPPEDDPPAVTPEDPPVIQPPADDPSVVHLEDHDIDASYLMEDGRQTLALRCLSTGASVALDVTGWQEELEETPAPPEILPTEEPPAQAAASTFTGRSSIIDIVFDKKIVFYLILEEDGTVRVKLDVTDAEA